MCAVNIYTKNKRKQKTEIQMPLKQELLKRSGHTRNTSTKFGHSFEKKKKHRNTKNQIISHLMPLELRNG